MISSTKSFRLLIYLRVYYLFYNKISNKIWREIFGKTINFYPVITFSQNKKFHFCVKQAKAHLHILTAKPAFLGALQTPLTSV